MAKIIVNTTEVSVLNLNGEDYICLTDMMKAKDGEFFVTDWLRNRNTLEYIGIWEKIYNPIFNYGEFAIIKNQAGLNRFKISVKDFEKVYIILLLNPSNSRGLKKRQVLMLLLFLLKMDRYHQCNWFDCKVWALWRYVCS